MLSHPTTITPTRNFHIKKMILWLKKKITFLYLGPNIQRIGHGKQTTCLSKASPVCSLISTAPVPDLMAIIRYQIKNQKTRRRQT